MLKFNRINSLAVIIILFTNISSFSSISSISNQSNLNITITNSDITIPIELTGRISPLETYDIPAPTNSEITEVYIKLGQKVSKNQQLLKLKSDQLEIDLRNANEALIRAELDYKNKTLWKNSNDVFTAEQTNIKNKLNLKRTQDVYAQNKKLYKQGIISLSELEQSKISYQDAKLNLELSSRQLKQIVEQGNNTQLKLLKLALDNAEAKLTILQDIKNKMLVTAPIDGVILKTSIQRSSNQSEKSTKSFNFLPLNSNVTTGENLLTVGNLQGFNVNISANEQTIQNINLDQKVNISIPALNNKTTTNYIGTITAVDAQPNNMDNTNSPPFYNIKITCLNNITHNIYLGMTAKINFNLIEKPNSILIPFSSIAYNKNNQPYVLKLTHKNQYKATYIDLGQTTVNQIEVLSGLKKGDVIKTNA